MGTPYKMKGFSGYGNESPLKQSKDLTDLKTQDKEIDLSKMSKKKILEVVKRNINVDHFKHKRTYDTRTDSVAAAREELYKRDMPKKKKK